MPITEVEGRRLTLSNLDRVLWPRTGTTKGELLHYYATVADVLLPYVRDRAASFVRTPDGVTGQRFFQKRPPAGTPDWVTLTGTLRHNGELMQQVQVDNLATLMWAANLACVELHVHQWPAEQPEHADRLVLDLDPGEGRTVIDCCRVALWLRERLAQDGIEAWPKTSGGKGLHLLAAVRDASPKSTSAYAKRIAQELQAAHRDQVVAVMAKVERAGRIFIDWSQNAERKTTAAPYTVRAQETPNVSTPLSWDEVAAARRPADLAFTLREVPGRVTERGDLMAGLLDRRRATALPP
jgi:bifunctional non-homologous end joining protein LigD